MSINIGDLVFVKLTGEIGMVLEPLEADNNGYVKGWVVRLPNYSVFRFADFEISERNR